MHEYVRQHEGHTDESALSAFLRQMFFLILNGMFIDVLYRHVFATRSGLVVCGTIVAMFSTESLWPDLGAEN